MKNNEIYQLLRERWDKEDSLLLSRTGVFLTANSILLTAAQLKNDSNFRIGVAVLAVIISGLWFTTSWHSYNVIKKLYENCKRWMPDEIKDIYSSASRHRQ